MAVIIKLQVLLQRGVLMLARRGVLKGLMGSAMLMPGALGTAKLDAAWPLPRSANLFSDGAALRYGSAVRASDLGEGSQLARLVQANCDLITPEIDMKWDVLQPSPNGWNFAPADNIVDFAQRHGLSVRGHTLLWEQSTPRWLIDRIDARPDWSLIESFFRTVIGRYDHHVCEWDVVNEPIDTEHGHRGIRRNVFQRAFGNHYISRSLREARRLAPHARLVINDYSLEYQNPVDQARRRAFLMLLERLIVEGVPLDVVGIQAHLDLSKGDIAARELTGFLQEIGAMGLEATITELDVKEAIFSEPIPLRDRRVADHVRHFLDVVLAEPAVRGVVTWGLSDKDSWLADDFGKGQGAPLNRGLPFDSAMQPKPAHWEIHRALLAHKVREA